MSRLVRWMGTAALGAVAWGTLVEPRLFTLRRHTLPALTGDAAPIRVLQLSDLHLAPWQHRKIEWIRSLVELKPDLLVLTGDLMGHRFARGPLMHALRPFADAGVAGVFVHGSNDYYSPIAKNPLNYLHAPSHKSSRKSDIDNAALTAELVGFGFTNLNNSAARLSLRGSELEFFGLGDPHIQYDNEQKMREQLDVIASRSSAARGEPTTTEFTESTEPPEPTARLGVVHAPYQAALNSLLNCGADVIFAGHTHGGQVRVPGYGALTTNCDLPTRLARGLDVWFNAERAAFLNVSAGMGASIYAPVRFACRPEASLITLEAARDSL